MLNKKVIVQPSKCNSIGGRQEEGGENANHEYIDKAMQIPRGTAIVYVQGSRAQGLAQRSVTAIQTQLTEPIDLPFLKYSSNTQEQKYGG